MTYTEVVSLNSISAIDTLHAIDSELHMVTHYGPKVGEPLDQISFEHICMAKAHVEALIKAQKGSNAAPSPTRYDLVRVPSVGAVDNKVLEPDAMESCRERVLGVFPNAYLDSDTTIRQPIYRNNMQFAEFLGESWIDAASRIERAKA